VVDETPRPPDHTGDAEPKDATAPSGANEPSENLAATRPYERLQRFPANPENAANSSDAAGSVNSNDSMATTERIEPLAPTATVEPHPASTPPRTKRKRGRIVLISVLVLIVLLVVGYFVAEKMVRDYAEGYVREQVVTALELPSGDGVGVDLGKGSFLLQAATGAITELGITVDDFTLGDISGSATAVAHHVPLDSAAAVGELAINVDINEDQLTALSDSLSGSNLDGVEIDGQNIRINASFKVLSVNIPISVALLPGAENGELVFTPVDITAAGQQLTADELRDGLFGGIATPLLTTRSVCIASELPAALRLDDVAVVGNNLVVTLDGDGAVLGEGLATRGTCE